MGTCAVGMIVLCCVGLAVRSIVRDTKKERHPAAATAAAAGAADESFIEV